MSELQKTQQKMCGNCLYGDYYRRRGRELRTWGTFCTKSAVARWRCRAVLTESEWYEVASV